MFLRAVSVIFSRLSCGQFWKRVLNGFDQLQVLPLQLECVEAKPSQFADWM